MIPKRAFRAGNEVVMSKEKVDRSKSEIGDSKGNLAYKERKRWTLFGLPFTFTEFYIYDNDIQIRAGLIDSNEDDCYMYRITDVKLKQSLFQKMFGLGTVECYTSDVTDKKIVLKNIRNAREIKDFIYSASEESKRRRRTVNMQNIGAYEDYDYDQDM
jgi:hypothetical protein